MRNLKRALSLGLTAAMISGLMVMGSSAASYADVTSEDNVEAIEVLESVGIMIGDESGNFNPDQNVTRNEMAVVMANLMEYNVASYKDTSPFTDVPSWAEPYVAACWTNGITAGYSDTIYGGSDTVTTAQAALMLMKALGYFQYSSDFGGDWQLATTRQGNAIDLFNGVDSGVTQAMTRNDVAQLVLNTLRAGTVEASTDGSWSIGDVTINNNVQYSYITSNQTYATAIDDARSTSNNSDAQRSIVELGEQLYQGDLKLNNNAVDNFGRPARTWSYDGKEVGTYAKTELLVESYTTGVTGRQVYDLLSAATINENDVVRYVDGFEIENKDDFKKDDLGRNNKDDLKYTGNGALTEVYLDDDNDRVTIATINTYLAQATSDYSEGKEYAPLDVYMGLTNGTVESRVYNVDVDDVAGIADVVDEAFYLVNISFADANSLTDYSNSTVTAIADPEVMENSTVTKWSDSDTKVVDKLTVDGTQYNAAVKAFYDEDTLDAYDNDLLTDMTYTLYLDQYGYVIGVDVYEGDLKYVFITGYDRNTSNLSVSTADAGAIFLDGTMDEIKVNVKATNDNIEDANDPYYDIWWDHDDQGGDPTLNRWYKYSVNESGVYTLKPADMTATLYNDKDTDGNYKDVTINTANVSVREDVTIDKTDYNKTRVYGEDASVYVTVDTDLVDTTTPVKRAITDVDGVYTGVQNVNLEIDTSESTINTGIEAQVYAVYDKDNYIIGAVVIGDVSGSGDYAYILSDDAISEEKIGDTYYWEFDAILDGQVQTLTAKSKYHEVIDEIKDHQFDVLELRFDTDEYVVRVLEPDAADVYDYTEATNEKYDIDDYEVYYVQNIDKNDNVIANRPLVLNLQGRTLYVTPNQNDMGLALDSDAQAVVIQNEYNKTNVKTEFTTVKSAISHLADANPNTPEIEYNGKIFAVLNDNGSAAWIVFDSSTGLNTSSGIEGGVTGNVKTERSGSSANVAYTVASNGRLRATFTYNVPAHIADGSTVSLDIIIRENGDYYDSISSGTDFTVGTVKDGKVTFTYTSNAMDYYEVGDLSFEILDETFTQVKVRYYDVDNKVYLDKDAFVAAKTDFDVTVGTKSPIPFQYDTNSTEDIRYVVSQSGKTVFTGGKGAANFAFNGGNASTNYTDADYVEVQITGLGSLTTRYTVTGLNDTLGSLVKNYGGNSYTDALTINIQPANATVAPGENTSWTTAVGTISSGDLGVKITFNTGDVITVLNTGASASGSISNTYNITSNFQLEITKVEVLAAPKVVSAKFVDANANNSLDKDDLIVVTFDKDIKATTASSYSDSTVFSANNKNFYDGDQDKVSYTVVNCTGTSEVTMTINAATSADDIVASGNYTITIPANATLKSTLTVTNP